MAFPVIHVFHNNVQGPIFALAEINETEKGYSVDNQDRTKLSKIRRFVNGLLETFQACYKLEENSH